MEDKGNVPGTGLTEGEAIVKVGFIAKYMLSELGTDTTVVPEERDRGCTVGKIQTGLEKLISSAVGQQDADVQHQDWRTRLEEVSQYPPHRGWDRRERRAWILEERFSTSTPLGRGWCALHSSLQ